MSLEEFEALPEEKRRKRGDVREDGAVFMQYTKQRLQRRPGVFVYENWKIPEGTRASRTISETEYLSRPDRRKVRGETREDGAIFNRYARRTLATGETVYREQWLSPAAFEKVKADIRAYSRNRPDIVKAAKCRYVETHRGACIERVRSRRRGVRAQRDSLETSERRIVECIYDAARRLEGCLGVQFHVDHIHPYAKGGEHRPRNLQALPAVLNRRKNDRLLEECDEVIQMWIPKERVSHSVDKLCA